MPARALRVTATLPADRWLRGVTCACPGRFRGDQGLSWGRLSLSTGMRGLVARGQGCPGAPGGSLRGRSPFPSGSFVPPLLSEPPDGRSWVQGCRGLLARGGGTPSGERSAVCAVSFVPSPECRGAPPAVPPMR